ncbi:hypothetical protein D3C81_152980 [compost metagenome]
MNISSVSSSSSVQSYSGSAGSSSSASRQIAALEKQKSKLEDDLKKLDSSKDDEKTKQLKQQQLTIQIKLLDAQIAQLKQQEAANASGKSEGTSEASGSGQVLDAEAAKTATTDSEGHFDVRV